jgi:hypothetical protein
MVGTTYKEILDQFYSTRSNYSSAKKSKTSNEFSDKKVSRTIQVAKTSAVSPGRVITSSFLKQNRG